MGHAWLYWECRHRFKRPYIHKIALPGDGAEAQLVIKQAKFEAEGFASTGVNPCSA
jgi:hypothetical protein